MSKTTIEQLIQSVGSKDQTKLPWHRVDPDLTKVVLARLEGKPVPSQKTLSDFFFETTGVRFSSTSIGSRLQKLSDRIRNQNGEARAKATN
jgi:hypothetical protein